MRRDKLNRLKVSSTTLTIKLEHGDQLQQSIQDGTWLDQYYDEIDRIDTNLFIEDFSFLKIDSIFTVRVDCSKVDPKNLISTLSLITNNLYRVCEIVRRNILNSIE
jgi:hypothetical protein